MSGLVDGMEKGSFDVWNDGLVSKQEKGIKNQMKKRKETDSCISHALALSREKEEESQIMTR